MQKENRRQERRLCEDAYYAPNLCIYELTFTNDQKQKRLELIETVKNETGKYPNCNSEIEIETS